MDIHICEHKSTFQLRKQSNCHRHLNKKGRRNQNKDVLAPRFLQTSAVLTNVQLFTHLPHAKRRTEAVTEAGAEAAGAQPLVAALVTMLWNLFCFVTKCAGGFVPSKTAGNIRLGFKIGAVCIPRSKFDRRTFSPTNHLADMKWNALFPGGPWQARLAKAS